MHRIPCGAIALLLSVAPVSAATCIASYYGSESGKRTANGERFNPAGLTAASRFYHFGDILRVTAGDRSIIVRVNDFGPAAYTGRCLDLSEGAARALHILQRGTAQVTIEPISLQKEGRRNRRSVRQGHRVAGDRSHDPFEWLRHLLAAQPKRHRLLPP